jgi:spore germination protein YaaH
MSVGQIDSLRQQQQPANADSTVVVDSLYSEDTHDRYKNRFQQFENRPDSTARWNSLLGVDSWNSVDLYKNLRDDIQVLGWHPYWAEDASLMYDYETLSMISYYGYSFNPADGSGLNPGRWRSTQVLERAHNIKKSVKLLLTVYSYNSSDNEKFFNNPDAMIRLVDDVTKLIDEKEAHGITLDFQNIPAKYRENYLTLIQQFSEQMAPKKQLVTLAAPASDPGFLTAVNQMVDFLDYIIVMGYDFHGTGNEAGPMSVLYDIPKGKTSSIESSVNRWLGEGVPKQKILVSLGWIGSLHQQLNGQHEHLGYRSYGYMKAALSDSAIISGNGGPLTIIDDKSSRTNSVTYPVENSTAVRTFYFADSTNFGLNLDWIQKDSLGGVAIWTLADAGNGDEYWVMLAEYFGRPPPSIMTYVIIPVWEFIVDEWLNPFLSLFLSILIVSLFLIAWIYISYKRHVPEWLRKLGVFLPLIVLLIMLFSLFHDLLAHYVVDRWDDPVKTTLSLASGTLVILISLWYCFRVYYLDRKRVP